MSKVQSNAVNDNTNTRVRFTVQRRPHRSNRDAREMLYDVDHDDTNTDSVEDIKLCNYYHNYTRTSTCQTSPSYSIPTFHASVLRHLRQMHATLPARNAARLPHSARRLAVIAAGGRIRTNERMHQRTNQQTPPIAMPLHFKHSTEQSYTNESRRLTHQ